MDEFTYNMLKREYSERIIFLQEYERNLVQNRCSRREIDNILNSIRLFVLYLDKQIKEYENNAS